MRLDKLLADQGYGTRKEVKALIKQGVVQTASRVLSDPSYHPSPEEMAEMTVDGYFLRPYPYHYFAFNKPEGILTALKGGGANPTVGDFLPPHLVIRGLVPVGRLDLDSSGLLLCTDDGALNHRLTAPKWEIPKRYYVELNPGHPPLDETMVERFTKGMVLEDGPTKPADVEVISEFEGIVTLREGRTRQLRRMFEAQGQEVLVLHRLSFGSLELYEDDEPGELRELEAEEIEALYESTQLPSPRLFN